MRVFVTGASGFIGSAVVAELLNGGHEVVGLARSDASAAAVAAAGAEVHRGDLGDLDGLCSAAAAADGVIHTAFIHDFSQIENSAAIDNRVVEAFGEVLEGSDRPLVITSGIGVPSPGRVWTEADFAEPAGGAANRMISETLAVSFASRGVRSSIVRPGASVHGEGDHGFVPVLIDIARAKGVSGYIGDGSNRWPAVHRLDTAVLYRLALESGPAGSVFHAVADEGIATRQIAELIGRQLDVPVVSVSPQDAGEHFGWMAVFFAQDRPASSELTRERLGWNAVHPGLVADLEAGFYFQPAASAAA